MAYEQMLVPVLEKQALAKNIYRMVLQCRSIAQQAACGQFVHLLPVGCTLRRPISICEINKAAGTLTIVFEVKGTGTDALANVRVGENVDILGPLGHGFTILPEAKHVVVVGGGIGNPFFSTDTTAALRAAEIGADVILMAKTIDGVYDSDPKVNPDAKRFETITHTEILKYGLKVMDATAASLCRDNHIDIFVFDMLTEGNIKRAVMGENIGTYIKE